MFIYSCNCADKYFLQRNFFKKGTWMDGPYLRKVIEKKLEKERAGKENLLILVFAF